MPRKVFCSLSQCQLSQPQIIYQLQALDLKLYRFFFKE